MSKRDIEQYLKARRAGEKVTSPRVALTQELCDWLPTESFDYAIRDSKMRGLLIRVRPTGHKTFDLVKRIGAKVMRPRVCEIDELPLKAPSPGAETVRTRAESMLVELRQGSVPSQEKAARVAEAKRDGTTVKDACDYYIGLKDRAESTQDGYKRMRDKQLEVHWPGKMIKDVTPDDVIALHAKISTQPEKGKRTAGYGKVAANNVLRYFRAVWKANRRRLGLGECPTVVFTNEGGKEVDWHPEKRRTRHIRKGELRDWWKAVQALRGDEYTGNGDLMADYLEFAFLTGLRRREITSLSSKRTEPNYIDTRNGELVIRENKSNGPLAKTDRTLRLPITEPMQAILDRREGTRLFPLEDPKKAIAWVEKRSGVKATSHDLRRTVLSHATAVGVPISVAKELVNHSRTGDVTEGYIQIDEATRRDYLERIQRFMLVEAGAAEADNVLSLEVANG